MTMLGRDRLAASIVAFVACWSVAAPSTADVWVFEPSVTLDQRFDDNYRLDVADPQQISATRAVGNLVLSREAPASTVRGLLRADVLLTAGDDRGDQLDSNQIATIESNFRQQRSTFGIAASFKQDTPSRDIVADLVDPNSPAADSGLVTQESNVARRRFELAPTFSYELSRRTSLEAGLSYVVVDHDLPSAQEAIYDRYRQLFLEQPVDERGEPLTFDEVSIDDVGVFSPSGELDDYDERKINTGLRYRLSPVSTVSGIVALSRYRADVEIDPLVQVQEPDFEPDDEEPQIRRKPRRESLSTTTSFRLGYDRALTETLRIGVQAGIYQNETDDSDTLRESDESLAPPAEVAARRASLESSQSGWLGNITLTKDAGLTRYIGRFAIDVQPSSIGTQVETQELIGEVYRQISPLLDLSFRARAYEPDRLGANPDDRFARRFLSLEPTVIWRFARSWTASAAYRYRRQKSRVEPDSGESNAVLFSLTYTPPSKIRDTAGDRG